MDHLVMATDEAVQMDTRGCRIGLVKKGLRTRGDLLKKLKRTRGCIKKLKRLENELSTYMASPEVLMLPGWKQSEGAAILQVVQTTLRQAIHSNWTQAPLWHLGPRALANVDQLIENATKMSLWLKRVISVLAEARGD